MHRSCTLPLLVAHWNWMKGRRSFMHGSPLNAAWKGKNFVALSVFSEILLARSHLYTPSPWFCVVLHFAPTPIAIINQTQFHNSSGLLLNYCMLISFVWLWTIQDIRGILSRTAEGRAISQSLENTNLLLTKERRQMVRILVSHLMETYGET